MHFVRARFTQKPNLPRAVKNPLKSYRIFLHAFFVLLSFRKRELHYEVERKCAECVHSLEYTCWAYGKPIISYTRKHILQRRTYTNKPHCIYAHETYTQTHTHIHLHHINTYAAQHICLPFLAARVTYIYVCFEHTIIVYMPIDISRARWKLYRKLNCSSMLPLCHSLCSLFNCTFEAQQKKKRGLCLEIGQWINRPASVSFFLPF